MILYVLALALGCLALYVGGDLLVRGASDTGRAFGLSPAVIGLLFVSFGTSAPELFVSAGAALQGYGDVAAGNALGSNIVNLCLVLGLGAVLGGLPIERDIRNVQLPMMIAITLLCVAMLADGHLGRLEGGLLLGATALGMAWAVRRDGRGRVAGRALGEAANGTVEGTAAVEPGAALPYAGAAGAGVPAEDAVPGLGRSMLRLLGGILVLAVGAEGLIYGGVGLAAALGVPDAVIALTVTSVGTGLPEITATVLAALRREHALAVANVVGSNVMNLGFVLGISATLRPIGSDGIDATTFVALIGLSFVLWALAWRPGRVSRVLGGVLLGFYALYVTLLVV